MLGFLTNPLLQANENPFMSKALRKAIMLRSRMTNLYLKNKGISVQKFFKTKKEYFLQTQHS